jgi:hypothetical protein
LKFLPSVALAKEGHVSHFAALLVLVLITVANAACLQPWNHYWRWLLPAYISELSHPYPTCYSEAARFLRENARKDDVVFCWPDFTHCPLVFYVGGKVRFGCTLTRDTTLPLDKVRSLPAPLLAEENFPDWVISFGANPQVRDQIRFLSRPHAEGDKTVAYSYEFYRLLDVFWFDLSRPELSSHSFGPVTNFDRKQEAVYVFRKVSKPIDSAREGS